MVSEALEVLPYLDQCCSSYQLQSLVGHGINLMDHDYQFSGEISEYMTNKDKHYFLKHFFSNVSEREERKKQ